MASDMFHVSQLVMRNGVRHLGVEILPAMVKEMFDGDGDGEVEDDGVLL